jgi:protein TonB
MNPDREVRAPLAVPTYLTHVTAPAFRRGRAALAAVLLHLAAILVAVAILHHRDEIQAPDPATVALVIEPSPYVGTGPSVISRTVTKAARAHASRQAPRPERIARARAPRAEPPRAAPRIAARPLAAPPALAAPRVPPALADAAAAAATAAAPAPHLGNNQPNGYGLVADQRIIPARPDSQLNLPPAYPPEALSHGEQGRVLLSIQVAPSGRASAVDIVASSGFLILDDAARDAVLGWHFLPAAYAGKPVPSTLLLPVRFEITPAGGGVQ